MALFVGRLMCLFLLFAYTLQLSSARNAFILSEKVEMDLPMMRVQPGMRSLKVSTNDYDQPSANRGHDPPGTSSPGRGGSGGGRRRG
ncbi:hypothetical protein CsatB_030093 [Cannabis sativa]|uniref:Uncharacterized protein n=1 Tax=Cannabis sativa TaxID=3483 RepID=A0A803R708_CANSA|nr:protein PSY3 [Cannabis sativa]